MDKNLENLHEIITYLEENHEITEASILHDLFLKTAAKKKSKKKKNVPTNPSLWAECKAWAKRTFDVYPSAYANGAAAKRYKSKGGGWKKASDESNVKTAQLIGGQDLNEAVDDKAKKLMSSINVSATNPTNKIDEYKKYYEDNKNLFNITEQQAIEKTFNDAIKLRERQGTFTTDVYQPYDVIGANSTQNEVANSNPTEDPYSDYINLSYEQIIKTAKYFLMNGREKFADGLINAVLSKNVVLSDPQKLALKNQYQRIKQNISDFGGLQDSDSIKLYDQANNLIASLKSKYKANNENLADRNSPSYSLVLNEIQKNPNVKLKNMALNLLRRIQMDFYKRK